MLGADKGLDEPSTPSAITLSQVDDGDDGKETARGEGGAGVQAGGGSGEGHGNGNGDGDGDPELLESGALVVASSNDGTLSM